ncbi:TonB-dependent receptor [Hydrocarboniphaga sp.]|uniref:TonB-dependent receptor n=1 Tax=Hydrocarboniphaga sp. TaxID=2033016 RepID=UPI003D0B9534
MNKLQLKLMLGIGAGLAAPVAAAQIEPAEAGATQQIPADAPAAEAPAQAAGANAELATIPVAPAPEPGEAEQRGGGSRLVEEVIVTAQKREENLQDVPISVQAFSAEALDARGVSDSQNLPNITPGMVYSVVAGYSIIYIRGVGTDAFVPSADQSVATYIDGIYFPFSHGQVQSFGAVERVEVLKGPQGTLFGRNSTGGAINVITKKPDDTFEGSVQTSFSNFNTTQSRAYVNVPVTDTLAFSVSGLYNHNESYYKLTADSPYPGGRLPDEEEKGGRVRVKWAPTEDFDITLSGLLVEQNGIGPVINQNTAPNPQYVPLGVTTTPPYQTSIDTPAYNRSRNPVYYGEANYRFDWFDTKLLASHQDIKTAAMIDYDNTKSPLVSFQAFQSARVDTQELQLISNAGTPWSDHLTWIFGLYHIESLAGFDKVLFSVGRDIPVVDNIVDRLSGILNPLGLGDTLDGLGSRVDIDAQGSLKTNSSAAYTQATLKLPYDFALTLGGRYQTERRELVNSRDALAISDDVQVPLFNFANQTTDSNNFSPKVTLDWHPVEDVLTYASFTKGFKSGTYNILNIYTPTQYIEPETVTAYELGFKSQLFDRRLQLNGAVFDTEIDNLQVQFVSLLSGGAVRFETAPHARVRGAEFDLLFLVAPDLLPGLILTANGSYLDAKYTDYPSASGFTDQGVPFGGSGLVLGGGVLPGQDFSGNDIVRSPKFSGTTSLSYTFNAPGGPVEIASDVYYNSGFFYSAQNVSTAEEKSYTTLDARASYLYEPWNTRITLFGKNLTNTLRSINQLPTDIGTWTTYAPPRTYGIRLNWDF